MAVVASKKKTTAGTTENKQSTAATSKASTSGDVLQSLAVKPITAAAAANTASAKAVTGTGTGAITGTAAGATNTSAAKNTAPANGTFTTSAGNTYNTFTYDPYTYNPYQKSDTVNQAWDTITQKQANAPAAWTDPYKDKYLGYLDQYENRDPFSYDFNSDALYQQYKDQYIQQGQMAMMDTMGQAAAMTGGYGNSYAQSVGQQAYNQSLSQLNDKLPELYDRAYNIYQQEGKKMLDMYDAYLGLSQNDYNQYLGDVDNYYRDLDASYNYYNTLYGNEFNEHQANETMNYNVWNANTGFAQDNWATQLGIESSENQMLMNQNFQASENQKNRDHTSSENQLNRDHEATQNQLNRDHTSSENQLNRDHTSSENQLNRDHEATQNQLNRDHEATQNQLNRDATASENQKNRDATAQTNAKNDLVNLIASSGYTPTAAELKAAGMTESQAKAYANVYKESKNTPSTSDGNGNKYKDIEAGSTAYNTIVSEVKKADSVEALQSLVNLYKSLGYNPDQIEAFTIAKYNELNPKDPEKPKDTTQNEGVEEKHVIGGRYLGRGY